jgi:hypothetical protein
MIWTLPPSLARLHAVAQPHIRPAKLKTVMGGDHEDSGLIWLPWLCNVAVVPVRPTAPCDLASAQHAGEGGQVRARDDVPLLIVGCFNQACSQNFTFVACVRAWLVATPFILGFPWHLDCCVFQDIDGEIMTFIFEEDRINSGGSISHA